MTDLFAGGQTVDLILAMIVIEALLLTTFRCLTGRGIPAVGLLINLLSGAFLLMALRNALVESPWTSTEAWLAAALLAHVADIAFRWSNR
jgi:hypothetical protein